MVMPYDLIGEEYSRAETVADTDIPPVTPALSWPGLLAAFAFPVLAYVVVRAVGRWLAERQRPVVRRTHPMIGSDVRVVVSPREALRRARRDARSSDL